MYICILFIHYSFNFPTSTMAPSHCAQWICFNDLGFRKTGAPSGGADMKGPLLQDVGNWLQRLRKATSRSTCATPSPHALFTGYGGALKSWVQIPCDPLP